MGVGLWGGGSCVQKVKQKITIQGTGDSVSRKLRDGAVKPTGNLMKVGRVEQGFLEITSELSLKG